MRFVSFVLSLVSSTGAGAQLVDCRVPQNAPYVVFLSEPQFTPGAFPNRGAMLLFFDRLHHHLDERLDREMAGLDAASFRVARCERRVPQIDGLDFTDDVVRSLHGSKVVVEIWGRLDRGPGGKRQPTARMNYLLVPIRRGVVKGSEKLPGMLSFDYPDRDIAASDFVDLVSNADLHAFVASAIGVSAFDNADYQLAYQMLCRASGQLKRTAARLPASKRQTKDIRELNAFLLGVAGESLAKARKLKLDFALLQEPANPCPGP